MNSSLYVGHESCRDYKKVLKSPHWAIRRHRAVGMSSFRPLLHHASYLAKEHSVTHHSLYHSVNHSVNAGSKYVDLQAASSTTPGWMADGATNNGATEVQSKLRFPMNKSPSLFSLAIIRRVPVVARARRTFAEVEGAGDVVKGAHLLPLPLFRAQSKANGN